MHGLCLTRNVCELSERVVRHFNGDDESKRILAGLTAYHNLLSQIYADDRLVKYQDALNALSLIFKSVDIGIIQHEKDCVLVNKNRLKQAYRKNIAEALSFLKHYSFYCSFYKNGEPVKQIKDCTDIELYYENSPELLASVRDLVYHARASYHEENYTNVGALLYKADFEGIYGITSIKSKDIDINREDIVKTLGSAFPLWEYIKRGLTQELRLVPRSTYSLVGCPQWTIHFYCGRKSLCHFDVSAESIYVGMAIPYTRMEKFIEGMDAYAPAIREYIRLNFHCYGCKDCGRSFAEEYKGIGFCKKNAWSRYIQYKIQTQEEAKTVYRIIETCVANA
jgi:hypothetical protein